MKDSNELNPISYQFNDVGIESCISDILQTMEDFRKAADNAEKGRMIELIRGRLNDGHAGTDKERAVAFQQITSAANVMVMFAEEIENMIRLFRKGDYHGTIMTSDSLVRVLAKVTASPDNERG